MDFGIDQSGSGNQYGKQSQHSCALWHEQKGGLMRWVTWARRYAALIVLEMALVAFGMAFLTYAMQHWGHVSACRLCYLQRWACVGIGVVATGVFLLWSRAWMRRCARELLACSWAVLSGLGGYHAAVQLGWVAVPAFCAVQTASNLDAFLALPTAACQEKTLVILGISGPFWVMACGLFFAFVSWIALGGPKSHKGFCHGA